VLTAWKHPRLNRLSFLVGRSSPREPASSAGTPAAWNACGQAPLAAAAASRAPRRGVAEAAFETPLGTAFGRLFRVVRTARWTLHEGAPPVQCLAQGSTPGAVRVEFFGGGSRRTPRCLPRARDSPPLSAGWTPPVRADRHRGADVGGQRRGSVRVRRTRRPQTPQALLADRAKTALRRLGQGSDALHRIGLPVLDHIAVTTFRRTRTANCGVSHPCSDLATAAWAGSTFKVFGPSTHPSVRRGRAAARRYGWARARSGPTRTVGLPKRRSGGTRGKPTSTTASLLKLRGGWPQPDVARNAASAFAS